MPKKVDIPSPSEFFQIDPAYSLVHPLDTALCKTVWEEKYRWQDETYTGMATRVVNAVYAKDENSPLWMRGATIEAIEKGLWMPAGRILAGAGTPKRVTLLNCFVNNELEDDMDSIVQALGNIMLTQQQGGGIGTDFSPLRPPGAILRRTGAVASGPGPFIDTWDSACATIRSAGDRRGAMMGTMGCWHPYLPEFITAKQKAGRWTNFNVSVLVTDAFMGAIAEDQDWLLYHAVPLAHDDRDEALRSLDFEDEDGVRQYVYSTWRARDLWDLILKSTYEYAEPGVIFIDRVNDNNNLQYCEYISCTNPCGEQPLPPHGCCDLGAVNLSRMVKNPFTEDAEFDWDLLIKATKLGLRFLDNVIDITNYPLPEQATEEFNKRRVGLGISGLADAMHFLQMRYGSARSCDFAEKVMKTIAIAAYEESADLANEKGVFPLYYEVKILEAPFIKKLPERIQDRIRLYGLRNGVLLTIAPTGTTTIAYGNGSSGLEPVFAHTYERKVKQFLPGGDTAWRKYTEVAYGARLYMALHKGATVDDLPSYMNVCDDVRVTEHVRIQEVCQKWVDASISKTINLPTSISYEDFKEVYTLAYESGCKGCTTYRPSETRGSILSTGPSSAEAAITPQLPTKPQGRPEIIHSRTCKIKWQGLKSALYLTVGYVDGKPYEIFLNSKDQTALEWVMALTILMSMAVRQGIPLESLSQEFQQIHALEGGWADGPVEGKQQYWPSLIAYIGFKMRALAEPVIWNDQVSLGTQTSVSDTSPESIVIEPTTPMRQCRSCNQYAVINQAGCDVCTNCGDSKCN